MRIRQVGEMRRNRARIWQRGQPLNCLDLYCGIGGSSLGAKQAGATIVAAVDQWELALKCHQRMLHPTPTKMLNCTVGQFEGSLDDIAPIDLILASPPCTAHSFAGGGKASRATLDEARNVVRYADLLRPTWLVIENVANFQKWHGYPYLTQNLEALGYAIYPCVLDASHYGVPQSRKRLFMLCSQIEMPMPPPPTTRDFPLSAAMNAVDITARNGTELFVPRRAKSTRERAEKAIEDIGEGNEYTINYYDYNQYRTRKLGESFSKDFIYTYYGNDTGYSRLDSPLRTATTQEKFAFIYYERGKHYIRMLHWVEYWRAMGFPRRDSWQYQNFKELGIPKGSIIKMLGNAVCPPVMRAIVESLMEQVK